MGPFASVSDICSFWCPRLFCADFECLHWKRKRKSVQTGPHSCIFREVPVIIPDEDGWSAAWLGSEYQIGGISMRTEDSLEQSLRRVLKAAGYMMRKSHASISPDNLGGYMIVDMSRNTVAAGGRFELTLEDVREWARDMC